MISLSPEHSSIAPVAGLARRKLYGRRKGKPLRAAQVRLVEELLPQVSVDLEVLDRDNNAAWKKEVFGRQVNHAWLEIGFGGGEHLAHQAVHNPGVGLIGCEPYLNGIAKLLHRIERDAVENVRVHPGDARDLIDRLPDQSVERVFVLYPDPWPKARHHRRRFMNVENLLPLARIMAPGTELRLATDIPDYFEHALTAVAECPDLFETAETIRAGGVASWPDWPGTRYEAKAVKAGRLPNYATFRRI
ncbi:MAG: tRNA (guanine(46)-N(7))-methyltransferase TrmB [Pseudomonadota bacterium]